MKSLSTGDRAALPDLHLLAVSVRPTSKQKLSSHPASLSCTGEWGICSASQIRHQELLEQKRGT